VYQIGGVFVGYMSRMMVLLCVVKDALIMNAHVY